MVNKLNISNIASWGAMLVIAFGAVASYAVNDQQISDNKEDIKELQKDKEQGIRVEERQKIMQEDLKEIKKLIREATQ